MADTTIPAPPPGTDVPNVTPFSEWQVRLDGAIATCVESAMTVLAGVYHLMPVNAQTDTTFANALIAQGQASANGATNWSAASSELKKIGLDNTAYGPDWFNHNDWQPVVDAALRDRKPVLFGLSMAYNLRDTYTGTQPDVGVYGHAITIVGKDATGYIVADPNTPTGGYDHYTAANLTASGASSMVVPTASPPSASGGGFGGVFSVPPGLGPVAMALDDAEQFPPFDGSSVGSIAGSVLSSGRAFFVRGLIVVMGLIIFLAALWWIVRPTYEAIQHTGQEAIMAAAPFL